MSLSCLAIGNKSDELSRQLLMKIGTTQAYATRTEYLEDVRVRAAASKTLIERRELLQLIPTQTQKRGLTKVDVNFFLTVIMTSHQIMKTCNTLNYNHTKTNMLLKLGPINDINQLLHFTFFFFPIHNICSPFSILHVPTKLLWRANRPSGGASRSDFLF